MFIILNQQTDKPIESTNSYYATNSVAGYIMRYTTRIPRPRFPLRRENFGDSRTFKADIGLLNICMGFQGFLRLCQLW